MPARVGTSRQAPPHIPRRIRAIALACPPAARVCEVGYDRGLILWSVLETRPETRGLGVEVQPESATATPIPAPLRPRVELRTGDGLDPVTFEEADGMGVILAGLGGRTIAEILERRPELTRRLAWVLTCPSHLEAEVRPALTRLGLGIADERLVEDRGRFYEVVVSRPSLPVTPADELAATWGPLLMSRPDPLMLRYLDDQAQRFAEAFARDLQSYREGTKAALGRKLALLGAARSRLLGMNPTDPPRPSAHTTTKAG
jgi:tRNA (adenine22-N1)-methyltransferase